MKSLQQYISEQMMSEGVKDWFKKSQKKEQNVSDNEIDTSIEKMGFNYGGAEYYDDSDSVGEDLEYVYFTKDKYTIKRYDNNEVNIQFDGNTYIESNKNGAKVRKHTKDQKLASELVNYWNGIKGNKKISVEDLIE